ncbi:MAG TPA: membrane protein insertion efficiency factor YidD [Candidatus Bathyarchaeia archaeon]|nr:membrane protein insertion efficiency factor YidD [Candidatus Bathyarchaeia archaeon]
MKTIICFLITAYQKIISRHLPRACRFYPTCSSYAKEAILRYGVCKGGLKSILRILRCNPFSKGGFDPLK